MINASMALFKSFGLITSSIADQVVYFNASIFDTLSDQDCVRTYYGQLYLGLGRSYSCLLLSIHLYFVSQKATQNNVNEYIFIGISYFFERTLFANISVTQNE